MSRNVFYDVQYLLLICLLADTERIWQLVSSTVSAVGLIGRPTAKKTVVLTY